MISKIRGAILISTVATFFGCATGEKVHNVRLDMNEDQVQNVLGAPDGMKKEGDYVAYQYVNRLISGWAWDRADYGVIFKDGKVIQYGAGEVRPDQSHQMLVIVPIRPLR